MATTGKRYAAARSGVSVSVKFAPDEAVKLVKELAFAKFDETVEIATRLGVDPRQADQLVRGTVVLPHGTGKEVRFHKVFAVSDSNWPMYDLDHGRAAIGYFPSQKSVVPESVWRPAKL